jgi:hypothetical protein
MPEPRLASAPGWLRSTRPSDSRSRTQAVSRDAPLTERKDVVDDLAVSGRRCLRAAAWRLGERSSTEAHDEADVGERASEGFVIRAKKEKRLALHLRALVAGRRNESHPAAWKADRPSGPRRRVKPCHVGVAVGEQYRLAHGAAGIRRQQLVHERLKQGALVGRVEPYPPRP